MAELRRTRGRTRTPYGTKHSVNAGDRIPHSDKVDPDDPARSHILITLARMEQAGVTIDDRAVEIATKLGRWHVEQALAEEPVIEGDVPRWRRRGLEQHVDQQDWVYYVRCGHLVKIGTTSNLASRFIAIRPNEVLALEPGGPIIEFERHREFATLRASGEYFHPGPALQQQILSLREAYGAPSWTRSLVPDGQNWFSVDSPESAVT